MSWFFNVAPYVLAIGAITLGAFEIVKDWKDYENKWLRIAVAGVFILVAVVSIASLHHDNAEKEIAAQKADGDMKTLQGKVDAAKQAQEDNTKLFLASMSRMSDQVGDLKTEVKTEALQKKLASVQADLQKTQRALAPSPKIELSFTFVPFVNPPIGQPVVLEKETTLPRSPDGSIHVEFTIANTTDVDAVNVSANIKVCDQCKYAKEPDGLSRLKGMEERTRFLFLPRLHAREMYTTISVDVIAPPPLQNFPMGFEYRCDTCVLPKDMARGLVYIKQP